MPARPLGIPVPEALELDSPDLVAVHLVRSVREPQQAGGVLPDYGMEEEGMQEPGE